MVVGRFAERLREPEYTCENRCGACTAVNTVLAAALGAAVGTLWIPAGVGVFAASLGLIYVRGYLVPGTPALTQRYFPRWLLARFHGDERVPTAAEAGANAVEESGTTDADGPYAFLDSIGAVEPRPEAGIGLTGGFRSRWEARIDRIRARDPEELLAGASGVDPEEMDVTVDPDGGVSARVGERQVGQWASRAILLADVAAWRELGAARPEWEAVPDREKRRIVGALRIFVERCSACDAPVEEHTETTGSCCAGHERTRVTGRCPECETTFFEETAGDLPYGRRRTHGSGVTMTVPPRSPGDG
jgi:hypothetical protein